MMANRPAPGQHYVQSRRCSAGSPFVFVSLRAAVQIVCSRLPFKVQCLVDLPMLASFGSALSRAVPQCGQSSRIRMRFMCL